MKPSFTLGIEEEYQTVDPETRDLRSHIHAEILAKGKMILQERVKAEMHQSVVEVGTSVCANIKEAKDELKKLRREMIRLAHAGSNSRRSLQKYCRRHAVSGARQPDLRTACSRRRRGSRDGDPHDESRALFCGASR